MPACSFFKKSDTEATAHDNHKGPQLSKASLKNPVFSQQQLVPGPQRERGCITPERIHQASVGLLLATTARSRRINLAQKEIRLLKVYAGKPTEPLRCTIHYVLLNSKDRVHYETVSYCCGPSPPPTVIEIDRMPAKVPKSAARVVHRMRLPDQDRFLWVDAICIDQADLAERGHQVALMGEIYGNSSRNLIWLGDDNGTADQVGKALNAVLKNIRHHTKDYTSFITTIHNGHGRAIIGRGRLLDAKIDVGPLIHLFNCDWWRRLWVVQEAALASTSLCHFGSAKFPLTDVLKVSIWLFWNQNVISPLLAQAPGVCNSHAFYQVAQRETSRWQYNNHLSKLMNDFRQLECEDPRDHVFALLGVLRVQDFAQLLPKLSEEQWRCIEPDYTKPKELVFRSTTRFMIEREGTLDALYLMGNDKRPESMPSWVLRIDMMRDQDAQAWRRARVFHVDGNVKICRQTWSRSQNPNIICLRGFRVTAVDAVYREMPGLGASSDELANAIAAQVIYMGVKENEYPTENAIVVPTMNAKRNPIGELAAALIGGINYTGHHFGSRDAGDFSDFMRYVCKFKKAPPAATLETKQGCSENERASRFFNAAKLACPGQRLFITKNNWVGLGPGRMRDDDIIVTVYGGHLPIVLRHFGHALYRYVGDCYLLPMMKGEKLRKHLASEGGDEIFEIG